MDHIDTRIAIMKMVIDSYGERAGQTLTEDFIVRAERFAAFVEPDPAAAAQIVERPVPSTAAWSRKYAKGSSEWMR